MRETRERLTYVFDVGVAIEAPDLFTAETTLGLVLDRMMAADYSVLSVAKYGAASVHRDEVPVAPAPRAPETETHE